MLVERISRIVFVFRQWKLDRATPSSLSCIWSIQANGSGINGACLLGNLVLAGDDGGAISITDLENGDKKVVDGCNAAQITGIECLDKVKKIIATCSVDQRLSVLQVEHSSELKLLQQKCLDVADIQCMTAWNQNGRGVIAVVGEGMALYQYK